MSSRSAHSWNRTNRSPLIGPVAVKVSSVTGVDRITTVTTSFGWKPE
jgi:hypothetical protein